MGFMEPAEVTRIGRSTYFDILKVDGFLGKVENIYRNGFDLIRENGHFFHFHDGEVLPAPFAILVNRPLGEWMGEASLQVGDCFCRNGNLLTRRNGDRVRLRLEPSSIVDLQMHALTPCPSKDTLWRWILLLIDEIVHWGRFEGVAGALKLLNSEIPLELCVGHEKMSVWGAHALPHVAGMVEGAHDEDLQDFEGAWRLLLGLGPGLTPSGDDFLVGFLAAHRLLLSRFGEKLRHSVLYSRLKKSCAWTVPQASQFLVSALEGCFSETLLHAVYNLPKEINCEEKYKSKVLSDNDLDPIRRFLTWGHSSGSDTLTGVVFGLRSMI